MMAHMPVITEVDPNSPGGRIRMLREAKDMTQEALASKVQRSQSAIAKYENNVLLPSLQTQIRIAEALGTRRSYLFPEAA
jgi:transcriptional regulator with XRE-family HTH domain